MLAYYVFKVFLNPSYIKFSNNFFSIVVGPWLFGAHIMKYGPWSLFWAKQIICDSLGFWVASLRIRPTLKFFKNYKSGDNFCSFQSILISLAKFETSIDSITRRAIGIFNFVFVFAEFWSKLSNSDFWKRK